MAGGNDNPTGPDLSDGIPLEELIEGTPLAGHVDGDSALMVRYGEEVFVVGGSCTHYGGALADGLTVDGTVRCPLHHACFSLRTGEAIGAPALNPLPRWDTEIRGGRVFPTTRRESDPLAPTDRGTATSRNERTAPETVVIVGGGAAGSAAAEMLRREGHSGRIVLVDRDGDAPYDRPNLSKDYLAGDAPEEWIPLRPDGFFEAHGIERVEREVQAIDPGGGRIRLADGKEIAFDALLLATGARPIPLAVPGAELDHVHLLRSLEDSRSIIRAVEEARSVVVVGASFIGMEVASALRSRELDVTVVAPEEIPFEAVLGTELGRMLLELHREAGVDFRLTRSVAAIGRDEVLLEDGSSVPAQVVVVGVGVEPETRLARSAGLEVDDGVVVDRYLETSAPGIFAAGDIARYPDPRLDRRLRVEHWAAAQRQGQAAARNLLGPRVPFTDVPFFWTTQHGVAISCVGDARGWNEVRVEGDPLDRDAAVRFFREGRLLAVATVGRDLEALEVEARMEAEGRERASP